MTTHRWGEEARAGWGGYRDGQGSRPHCGPCSALQAVEMIQNVIEDVKVLKEAHEKAQENVQEFPELMPQVRALQSPPLLAQPVYTEPQTPTDPEPTQRRAEDLSE